MIAVSFFHHYYRLPEKLDKLSIRGRKQRYSRPQAARLAAASNTIRGRKSMTSIRACRNSGRWQLAGSRWSIFSGI